MLHGRRPRIGLCTALERARWTVWDREAFLLSRAYVDALQRAGAIALMIPPDGWVADHPADVLDGVEGVRPRGGGAAPPDGVVDGLEGLVLAGGADIDPASYGDTRHPKTTNTRPDRDRAEIALALRALDRDLPVLGICRGMQLINVALGGTLVQHLPDDVGHTDHRRVLGSFDNADHDVRLQPGSLAARACGEIRHATKSHHHQAVASLGEGVVASGWSVLHDLVEAIEVPDSRWTHGVQWHPEVDPRSRVVRAFALEAARVPAAL